jgi:hypothetical protein
MADLNPLAGITFPSPVSFSISPDSQWFHSALPGSSISLSEYQLLFPLQGNNAPLKNTEKILFFFK